MSVTVRGVKIGEGLPKICASIIGKTIDDIKSEAKNLQDCDIVEWRADFFNEVECTSKVDEVLSEIRKILVNKPIIFTFRTVSGFYFELYKHVVNTGVIDIIDIDLQSDESEIKDTVKLAHTKNIVVIVSSHNFTKTQSKSEIIAEMEKAQILGDISKIAVMPNNMKDVITLLDATVTMNENFKKPFIAISMSSMGIVSRLCCEDFGSAITFASGKSVSASGQASILETKEVLKIIHSIKQKKL